jgi:autotransporter-associated beta strand protein
MRRTIATILVGSFLTTGQAAPVFTTGTGPVTMSGDFSGYINLGLQGVGRIPASKLDAFGDTFGSVSGLQITNWRKSGDGYAGSFMVLPDRGYNSGAVYSDYRARVQQVDFSFSPYTGAGSLSSTQSHLALNYMGGSLIRQAGGTANTTGALPTSSVALQVGSITSGTVPTTTGGKISFDAEGMALFKDGSGYITDEYGPNIYYVRDGQIGAVINPPASAMPRTSGGSLTFTVSSDGTSAVDPTSGRRSNQGMEAVAITPDGKTLFTMLQSATMQDSVSGGQNRQFTRLYKYDVAQSRENPVLTAEYVVELPRFNDTKADQTGLVPNKVAAQSEMVALDGDRLLLLARDGNGNGNSNVTPAIFKSVMLMDLAKGSPTNIASLDTTPNYSVISGTVSSPIVSGTTTLTDTTVKLNPAITPVSPVQFLNLIGQNDLSKFGLNTNDGSAANPRSAASLSEKWEGMALVSALDPAKPNDYFLFVGNDNDFLTSNLKMKSTTGAISTTAGPFGASVENDTMFLAYRLTLPTGGVDQSILTIGSSAASASMAAYNVVDTGSGLASGTSKYGISGSTLLVPGSLTVTRPIDVGLDGGGVNLLGHSVVLNGSVSGTGALTVFGTSTGARLGLGGNNSFEGGLEISGVRVEASQAKNLGTGQVNLNAGAVLSLLQSGTFSQAAGLYVGGGTMEVAATNEVLWTGSIVGPGRLTKVGAGSLALSGASTFSGGLTVQEGVLALGASSLAQGETLTASPVGTGTLTVQGGASLAFKEQGIFLLNTIRFSPGINEAAPVVLDLGDNLVEFAGPVDATASLGVQGTLGSQLTFWGTTSLSGDVSVQGATVRLSESFAKAPETITLRSGGGLQSLGDVQIASTIVLHDTGRLDGGEGVLALSGDITGAGTLRIGGSSPFGTVRLEGLNTYTGGTFVEDTRVEIAVHGEEGPTGLGGVFGSGDVSLKNATLAFATSSRISNTLKLQGEVTIDVAENIGELAGAITDDVSGPGSLYITGSPLGALTLSGTSNSYTGPTVVEGTTLRLLHNFETPSTITLRSSGGLQSLGNVQVSSAIVLEDEGRLDGGEGLLSITGDITGTGRLRISGSPFGTVRLEGLNSYTGGTFLEDTRVEVAVHGGEGPTGTEGVFGSGDVNVKNATLAFATSSRIHNPLSVHGELTIDVAEHTGELAGSITDDVSGPGSLYITGSPLGALVLSGSSNSYTGPTVVEGATLRLLNTLETPGTITLRSGGGLQSLGDVQISSTIVLEDEGRLDGGEGLLALSGDITGAGRLRIVGSPFGTVRLEGLNTYTGGTSLEDTRVEVAVHGGEGLTGTEGVFGSGEVSIKNATLAFATASRIQNTFRLHGELTIDVAENIGELSGSITDDVSGPGSLYITGSPLGALTLSGTSNSYTGPTVVEGTTLRLLHTPETPGTFTLRSGGGLQSLGDVQVSSMIILEDEGRLDGGEGVLSLAGDITGNGRLRIVGNPFGTVRLEGLNTYTGGTTVEGTRVEVAVHGPDEGGAGSTGSGAAFGSGEVNIRDATLAFATSARIPNAFSVHGGFTIDVAEHIGELSGSITDDVSGPGSLYITGSPLGALTLSGTSTSYTGPTVVEGTTLRLLHNFETPSAITLRSSGGLQSLGNVQVSSSIVLEDEGRLDGGEGLLSLTGDITGTGRLRISGSPFGTVRLEGLNSYTGGTSLEDTRVEVAVYGGEGLTGTEGVFGSGDVNIKNATLAFATSSRIQNALRVNGELTIDVGENTGELGGSITDDVSGPGSLYITGSPLGALTLSGSSNSYTGPTTVEGTTLRLLNTPETPGAITLRSGGGLQSLGDVHLSSAIVLEDEGRLDGGEGLLTIAGDITGAGRLRIAGSPYGTVRLEGLNTYTGGTSLEDTRVEIAVHGGEAPSGSGGVFGSGEVSIKNATLAFATSSRVQNTLRLNGELTVDVGENTGELSGAITDDVSGPGSLYITGSPLGALMLSGTSNSYTGPTVVEGTTLRLLHTPETSGTITLRSGGALQSLGNVQLCSSVVLEDEGRLDGGDGVLSLVGDITGNGRLRIVGNPFGTVRLEGLNTYTGGTTVEDTRVEVAVYGADDSAAGPIGSGGAFGSGEVNLKNAALAFGTSSRIPNALRVHGELTIDVAENTGELSGSISDDASGPGSLYVTGGPRGALMLSGTGSSYTGPTIVEGTTLRLLHNADTTVLGVGTHSSGGLHPIQLDGATLQIVPDYSLDAAISATPVTGRGVVFGARGATLDASDSSVVWTGVISGGDRFVSGSKLTVAGAAGSQVELAGANTYVGGTDIQGGVLVKLASDDNLGATGTPVTLSNGGLFYGGSGAINWSRPLTVLESGLIDVGSRTVTVTGALSGGGILEVGRKAYEGSTFSSTTGVLVVGTSIAGFTGRTVVSGGSLLVSTGDALGKSTLETVENGGSVGFATPNVSLGGLAGDGPLHLSTAGTLSVGTNGRNTRYSGVLSGGSLALAKVGSGNLSLGAVNTYAGPTNIQEGTLTLELGADLGPAPISLSSKVTLVINGAGRDLSTKFGSVAADSLVVFNGSDPNGVLKLPSGFAGRTLSLGAGGIQVGTAAATSGSTVGKGVSISLTSLPSSSVVTLSGGSVDLSAADGSQITVDGVKSLESKSTEDVVTVKEGGTVRLTAGLPSSAFKGTFQTDGQVIVSPTNSAEVVDLPRLKGTGKLALQGGSAVIVASPEFTGTTSISNGASAVLTGSLGIGSGAALELATGSSLRVVPQSVAEQVTLPSLSGGGSVSLQAGKVLISGGNSAFSGSLTVAKGVDVTVRGDLPTGTINVVDPALPLKVDSSAGNVSIPGTVTGAGGLTLAGGGTFTLTGNAKIETAQLLVGGNASERPTLDVSSLAGGVLTLSKSQSLGGGGTIVGSVVTSGIFAPGNSPGTLTVEKNTVVDGSGNLTLDSGARILIEYGVQAGTSQVTADRVVVAGTLTLGSQVKIVVSKFVDSGSWTSFVTPANLDLGVVFSAGSIVTVGSLDVSLEGNPLLSQPKVTSLGTTLSLAIEKVPYATHVTAPALQPLAQYLFAAGTGAPSTGLARYLSVLDASMSAAELSALVASLQSPVYAEAQRLSLRRTAAVSETLQGRLVRGPKSSEDGWAAWSESYGWSFHRGATANAASWNGRNFGEILGVQTTRAGLTFGLFGAAGTTNASFSAPGSSLSGESFHGGAFVHAESGGHFVDASILAGRAEQTAVRNVNLGAVSGQGRARFSTGEYAGHLRFGLQTSELAKGLTLKPSVAVLFNGYSQGGAAESGLDGVGVVTRKESGAAWQTRLGFEAMKKAQLGGKAFDLLASAYWVRDANRSARSVETRFNGSSVGGYSAEGSALGANGLELGVGAGVNLTPRTSARLNGVWQVREGSSQPGVNVGVTVQF